MFLNILVHAILSTYVLAGHESIAVIFPDVIINEYKSNFKKENLSEMLKQINNTGYSQIMVQIVKNTK